MLIRVDNNDIYMTIIVVRCVKRCPYNLQLCENRSARMPVNRTGIETNADLAVSLFGRNRQTRVVVLVVSEPACDSDQADEQGQGGWANPLNESKSSA
eukprot:3755144-Pleurochrysis_carterae.AAC.4